MLRIIRYHGDPALVGLLVHELRGDGVRVEAPPPPVESRGLTSFEVQYIADVLAWGTESVINRVLARFNGRNLNAAAELEPEEPPLSRGITGAMLRPVHAVSRPARDHGVSLFHPGCSGSVTIW